MTNLRHGPGAFGGGGVSEVYTTPFPHALGTFARDADGNEYVFCDYSSPVCAEMVVAITPITWTAAPLTTTSRGLIGVVPDYAKLGRSADSPTVDASYQWTSDNAGWVQVYGRAYIGIGASDSSPSDAANGPTTVDTSARIMFKRPSTVVTPLGTPVMASGGLPGTSGSVIIRGMWVATDVTLAQVSMLVGTSAAVTEPTNMASFHAIAHVAVILQNPYLEVINSITD